MSKEAGEVSVVEGFVLQLIDRTSKGDLLGDGGAVGPDEVDLGVIGAGPVAADRIGDRGGDRGGGSRGSPAWAAGLPFGQDRSHFTWRLTWFRNPAEAVSRLLGLAVFLYGAVFRPAIRDDLSAVLSEEITRGV
ncbi:hypothetical protein [Streptomyces sp. NPDC058240]|uniref:hypothetical protein n=1 Tax=Streptomyces sp. NPDC058240 TaxID=3346396 RepID=UPI0036E62C1D